jgi:hypothetical protein
LLTGLQSESLLLISQTVQNKPSTDLLFSEIFHQDFSNCFSAKFEFPIHHPKSYSTISWNQFPNCFDHVRCLNGCWWSTAFVIVLIFTAAPKFCIPFKDSCTRESIVTISLFCQLESFSNCFAHLEKQNFVFALCSITTNCHNDLHSTKS